MSQQLPNYYESHNDTMFNPNKTTGKLILDQNMNMTHLVMSNNPPMKQSVKTLVNMDKTFWRGESGPGHTSREPQ